MEPWPVKEEEDFSHQEELEKEGTRASSPLPGGGSTGLYELARCSTWMVLVVTVRQMSLWCSAVL